MDILASMFAYVAGIGALVAGLAVSFFVFFAVPQEPIQTQAGPQTASAMLVRPSMANKPVTVDPHAKQSASHSEEHAAVAALPSAAQPTAYTRDFRHTNTLHQRFKRGSLSRRSAPAAGRISRIQVSIAAFSVTPTDRSRVRTKNLQA